MGRLRFGKGRAEVIVEGDLVDAAALERKLRAAMGPVADAMELAADALVRKHRATWPVFTGRSKAALRVDGWRLDPGNPFKGEIVIATERYAMFIRSDKLGKRKHVVRNRAPLGDLRKDANRGTRALAKEIVKAMSRPLREVFDG